jgi:hypothetical protein
MSDALSGHLAVQHRLARQIPTSRHRRPLERRICEHLFVAEHEAKAGKMSHVWVAQCSCGWLGANPDDRGQCSYGSMQKLESLIVRL